MNVKNDKDESRMASGRLFQVHGPMTANNLSLNEVYMRGTWSFPLSADLNPGRQSTRPDVAQTTVLSIGGQNNDNNIN